MESIKIAGELRKETGSKFARAFRRAGMIPCELYGGDVNIHFTATPLSLKHLVYTPEFKVAELEIDGQTYRAIMKSIQFHPVSEEILHIDFLRLVEGVPVKVEVPVRFSGVAPGVKAGGKLTQKVHRVQIKTLPEHLVDQVTLDIGKLKLGQSVRVRDINVDSAIEILNNPGIPLASIAIPRALKSAGAGGEEGEEGEGEGEDTPVAEEAAAE